VFVVAFLNPCFSLLYLKVYFDTKSIFIVKVSPMKLEQIWPKITFMKYAEFGPRIPPFGRRFFTRARLKKPVSIRAPNWQFPEISISSILSHFHNNNASCILWISFPSQ